MDAVGVKLGLAEIEVVDVPVEGVFFVEREEPVFKDTLDGGLPGPDQQVHLLVPVEMRPAERIRQLVQVGIGDGQRRQPGVQHEPVPVRLRQLRVGLAVGSGGSRASRSRNSRSRVSWVWVRMPSAMEWTTPCFQPSSRASLTVAPSPWDRRAISARVSRRVFSSNWWVGACGFGDDGDHLGPAGLEGLLAVPVGTGDDAGLLATEGACACG